MEFQGTHKFWPESQFTDAESSRYYGSDVNTTSTNGVSMCSQY